MYLSNYSIYSVDSLFYILFFFFSFWHEVMHCYVASQISPTPVANTKYEENIV